MMSQATQKPASDPVDCLFVELMSYEFALEGDQGLDTDVLDKATPSCWADPIDETADTTTEDSLEPFFQATDLFALELDLCISAPSSPDPPAPVFSDLSAQATSSIPPQTMDNNVGPQSQPKKRKRISKTSSQRQREEITRLRATAAALEQQLQSIRALARRRFSVRSVDSPSASVEAPQSFWECVARCHDAARRQAEESNAALRQEIKTNLTLAKRKRVEA